MRIDLIVFLIATLMFSSTIRVQNSDGNIISMSPQLLSTFLHGLDSLMIFELLPRVLFKIESLEQETVSIRDFLIIKFWI